MKLWYTRLEMIEARKEAQRIVNEIMRDLPVYIKGDVQIKMAWREDFRSIDAIPLEELKVYREASIPVYLPEAELLVNGEVCRRDLLDLLHIDILRLEMKLLVKEINGCVPISDPV